jgi:integrase
MPQKAKGARLYQRKDTGLFLIRDTGRGERSTGTRDRREAEAALAAYIAERDRPRDPAQAGQLTVAAVLDIYAREHGPTVRDPVRIGYAMEALLRFWEHLPVAAIKRETCRAYARQRVKVTKRDPETGEAIETAPASVGTIRKELGVLAAAVNYCAHEGYLVNAPRVHLPPRPEPKDRWLTRHEAARLLRAAWRNPETRHIARFILVGLYTGSRKGAILGLRFIPNTNGGHVDLDKGVLYRRSAAQIETKKRTPPIPLSPRLLAHMRRWKRAGGRCVVSYKGQGVGSIKTAWAAVVRDAGLEGSGVVPHTLRHTAITWAMQAGTDIYQASGYFGVSVETMMRVYAHHHPDYLSDALAAVGRGGRKM